MSNGDGRRSAMRTSFSDVAVISSMSSNAGPIHWGSVLLRIVPTVGTILRSTLPQWMGPAFEDIDEITATSENEVRIALRRPSPLLIEALDSQIRKPDGAGTGPFKRSEE